MKTIGIVGGMGPEATCDLYLKIIRNTPAEKDQDHFRVIIDSNPKIPDRTAFIIGQGPDPRPILIETARNAERAGASFLAMPCNTAHYFHEDVKEAVSIPVLHMMDEVASYLKGKVDQVGILASAGTLRTGLYEKALSAVGITAIAPGEDDQKRVMESIYLVKAGKLEPAREIILEQGKLLADRGAQAVIAGCTEIPLILKQGDLAVEVVDATDILAKACVRFACKD
ncbi:MAG: aspartate/glutamate racemase family protein [Bacillota bacterium]|jgi:aspartate racemase|nr:amino acid racemase [Candidatus Fermentithermobacillaceae bacterium]